jgi:serine protease Do
MFKNPLALTAICAAAAGLAMAPSSAQCQAQQMTIMLEDASPLALHASSAGYLGVDVTDIDSDKAQTLKLKEVRGALITLIDHDAPAGQVGLKVNDVVLGVNGQSVEGAEALRRILHEIPPGRKISLEISRDGNIQTLAVQLVDRKEMEHDVWNKLLNVEPGPVEPTASTGMGIFSGGDAAPPSGFHMSIFTSTLNVGAMVEPLTSQMAEYFGVPAGLMVKQVARKSEAANAGLKAFDVILKVDADSIATSADWDRALRSNQGKPVQVTILRDKKQQTVTLQVDSKHHSEVEYEDLFGPGDVKMLAESQPLFELVSPDEMSAQAAADANATEEAAKAQADALSQLGNLRMQMSQEQAEALRKQAEKMREGTQIFKIDPEQMQQWQQQSEKLRESMKDFKVDPKQMEQMRQQMQEFQKGFNSEQMKQWQQQMDRYRQQMKQWQEQDCSHCV